VGEDVRPFPRVVSGTFLHTGADGQIGQKRCLGMKARHTFWGFLGKADFEQMSWPIGKTVWIDYRYWVTLWIENKLHRQVVHTWVLLWMDRVHHRQVKLNT
jgi:hypothetical protein